MTPSYTAYTCRCNRCLRLACPYFRLHLTFLSLSHTLFLRVQNNATVNAVMSIDELTNLLQTVKKKVIDQEMRKRALEREIKTFQNFFQSLGVDLDHLISRDDLGDDIALITMSPGSSSNSSSRIGTPSSTSVSLKRAYFSPSPPCILLPRLVLLSLAHL